MNLARLAKSAQQAGNGMTTTKGLAATIAQLAYIRVQLERPLAINATRDITQA